MTTRQPGSTHAQVVFRVSRQVSQGLASAPLTWQPRRVRTYYYLTRGSLPPASDRSTHPFARHPLCHPTARLANGERVRSSLRLQIHQVHACMCMYICVYLHIYLCADIYIGYNMYMPDTACGLLQRVALPFGKANCRRGPFVESEPNGAPVNLWRTKE